MDSADGGYGHPPEARLDIPIGDGETRLLALAIARAVADGAAAAVRLAAGYDRAELTDRRTTLGDGVREASRPEVVTPAPPCTDEEYRHYLARVRVLAEEALARCRAHGL